MHIPSLITVQFLLFIKLQLTRNAQYIIHPLNAHLDTSDRGLFPTFIGPGAGTKDLT